MWKGGSRIGTGRIVKVTSAILSRLLQIMFILEIPRGMETAYHNSRDMEDIAGMVANLEDMLNRRQCTTALPLEDIRHLTSRS